MYEMQKNSAAKKCSYVAQSLVQSALFVHPSPADNKIPVFSASSLPLLLLSPLIPFSVSPAPPPCPLSPHARSLCAANICPNPTPNLHPSVHLLYIQPLYLSYRALLVPEPPREAHHHARPVQAHELAVARDAHRRVLRVVPEQCAQLSFCLQRFQNKQDRCC